MGSTSPVDLARNRVRKIALLATAAIALLGAAGISAILLLGKEPAARGPAAPPLRLEASLPAPSPPPAASVPAPAPPPLQPPAAAVDPRPPVPGPPPLERQPAGPTPPLASFGREAHLALRPFADRIADCARGERPAGPTAKVVVRLERLRGRVRVLGVQAERGRPGSAALERCARAELVGRELAVPGSLPGPPTRVAMPVR